MGFLNLDLGEFTCPVCKAFSDCVVPIVSPEQMETPEPVPAPPKPAKTPKFKAPDDDDDDMPPLVDDSSSDESDTEMDLGHAKTDMERAVS